MYKRVSFITPY